MTIQKELFIIKIGGSIITNKASKNFIIQEKLIHEISNKIAQGFNPKKQNLLIIHGAGSAGHAIAKKYDLINGTHNRQNKECVANKIQENIHHLQKILTDAFISAGCSARLIHSNKLYTNTKGLLTSTNDKIIEKLLKKNIIPVISGSIVSDILWGKSILSSDTLIAHYTKKLRPHTVALASDIDGIFTKDPHIHKNAQLIKEIKLHEIIKNKTSHKIDKAHTTDVTGGLIGKLKALAPLLNLPLIQKPKSTFIFNGNNPSDFTNIFHKNLKKKTIIHL